jgi:hypothetical protein
MLRKTCLQKKSIAKGLAAATTPLEEELTEIMESTLLSLIISAGRACLEHIYSFHFIDRRRPVLLLLFLWVISGKVYRGNYGILCWINCA